MERWLSEYPRRFGELADSRGRPPQHTFFYPAEVYQPGQVEQLSELVRGGWGDVELHLHHDNDSDVALRERLDRYVRCLHDRHGLFTTNAQGQLRYGFIHGNWALDNSHPQGRWCGVNNELTVLRETGCYADFTMPAAPHAAQTRTINRVYYAFDDPRRPKSHDTGQAAALGCPPPPEGLLMIQGPLLVVRREGTWCRPQVENGNLSLAQPPSIHRLRSWLRAGVGVRGCADWSFVKLHTHGAQERCSDLLLGDAMVDFHRDLHTYAQRFGIQYFYVTAREMAQLVHQAEAGLAAPEFASLSWIDGAGQVGE